MLFPEYTSIEIHMLPSGQTRPEFVINYFSVFYPPMFNPIDANALESKLRLLQVFQVAVIYCEWMLASLFVYFVSLATMLSFLKLHVLTTLKQPISGKNSGILACSVFQSMTANICWTSLKVDPFRSLKSWPLPIPVKCAQTPIKDKPKETVLEAFGFGLLKGDS